MKLSVAVLLLYVHAMETTMINAQEGACIDLDDIEMPKNCDDQTFKNIRKEIKMKIKEVGCKHKISGEIAKLGGKNNILAECALRNVEKELERPAAPPFSTFFAILQQQPWLRLMIAGVIVLILKFLLSSKSPTNVTTSRTAPPINGISSAGSKKELTSSHRQSLSSMDVEKKNNPFLIYRKTYTYRFIKAILRAIRNTALDEWTLKELIFAFFAIVGAVLSLLVIVFEIYFLVNFVAILCIVSSGTTVFMQRTLTDLENIRELNNQARHEANKLRENNTMLEEQNEKLEESGEKLKSSIETLQELGRKNNVSVDMLIEQVEKYQKIQNDIKRSVKDQIRQTLISAIMDSDIDHDYVISGDIEYDRVCRRLDAIPMVKFNKEAFMCAMEKVDGAVLIFTKDYLQYNDESLEEENIFEFLNK